MRGFVVDVLSAWLDDAIAVEPAELFAANLRRHRMDQKLSQEALGDECGLHRTEVGLLERGDREPRLGTLVKLARGLHISLADLLSGIG